ncbi:NUDIX hydrolase [Phytoactinopolyspora halotolerans]|uniref:NUDIX domain-containing protein n=1 Tax=Phytoactinopolyspora halotolerans TaxID=1981512 RepID=A0A6L9S900_9ACTN|nr:NUDIX domain-containing protein [Phytoactinopolyspora halotolerans]NEE01547.1 NUDIX domain-containing protein [Phytoactinopolyspora halotolerans]
MVDRFRVVPAAYVLLRRERGGAEQVWLELRRNTGYMDGYWAVPAGHVEHRESVFAAACREVAEELGVTVAAEDLRPLCVMHRTGGNGLAIDERVDFFFECRRWAGEPHVAEPEKAADMRWFPLDALPEPIVPHEYLVIDRLRKGDLPAVVSFGFDESDAG